MKPTHLLACATFVLLGACKDSTGPSNPSDGSVSFSYTAGAATNSYSATGTFPSGQTVSHTSTYSTAWSTSADNSIAVLSNRNAGGGLADGAFLIIDRQTVGTSTIDEDCEPTDTTACTLMTFAIGVNEAGSAFSLSCVLTEGTVTISEVSSTHISGTFQGESFCFTTMSFADGTVTGGTFTMPLHAEEPGGF